MLKELAYELSRGLAYRRIRHSEMRKYTVILPLFLYGILVALYFALPAPLVWLGRDGLVAGLLTVLSTLPGFYFAGLAAVATFGAPGMDREMEAAPQIDLYVKGHDISTSLTKRQFLSYLFSYLVIISFVICFGLLILNTLDPSITIWHGWILTWQYGSLVWSAGKFILSSAFTLIFTSMVVTTLHGIFFLTERIHQP
jgi:hypothetical protein